MKQFLSGFFALAALSASFTYGEIIQVQTDAAPRAVGPFSQAVVAGPYLFVSGQLGIDPATGQFVNRTIEEQTLRVFDNLEAILDAQGLTFENVVRVEVFLKDMNDFQAMNAIYATKFSQPVKPARQTVQVAKLPFDGLVEISCIAWIP